MVSDQGPLNDGDGPRLHCVLSVRHQALERVGRVRRPGARQLVVLCGVIVLLLCCPRTGCPGGGHCG